MDSGVFHSRSEVWFHCRCLFHHIADEKLIVLSREGVWEVNIFVSVLEKQIVYNYCSGFNYIHYCVMEAVWRDGGKI